MPPIAYRRRLTVARAFLADRGPSNLRPNGTTPKHREGLRHEARAHAALATRFGDLYLPSPWLFAFEPGGAYHFAQPDGLLFLPERGLLVLIEAKLKHTATAFFQTENLYLPIVRKVFPLWDYATCEVVRWYDYTTPFPGRHRVVQTLTDLAPGEFAVHILRSPTHGSQQVSPRLQKGSREDRPT